MQIVVTHLTRMAHGYICVAGNETESMRNIRPVLRGRSRLQNLSLSENGGPFVIGGIVDIGETKPVPQPPETEDHLFFITVTKRIGMMEPRDLWQMLALRADQSLSSIFGRDLIHNGRSCTVIPESGIASLGFLLPAEPPRLHIRQGRYGTGIRIDVSDGDIACTLSVTDVRLYREDDYGNWVPRNEMVEILRRHLSEREPVILGVGLTRPFARDDEPALHWLQVNNIHVQDHSIFQQTQLS